MLRSNRPRLPLAVAGLGLVAALAAARPEPEPAADGGAAEVADAAPETVRLADLREDPGAFLAGRHQVVFQLSDLGQPWQPLLSRFGPADFERVRGWCDTQLPWDAAAYADPAPYLFVRRDSTEHFLLRHARAHERFLATVEVREQFLSEPWCEIVEARRIAPSINEGTVLHAVRAQEILERGSLELALSELDRALASPLPDHARAALEAVREGWIADSAPR